MRSSMSAPRSSSFKNTDGKYFTMEEYETLIKPNQEDKNKKLVYLYTTNRDQQFSYIEKAQNKGYDVLCRRDGQLDAHFVNQLESKPNQRSLCSSRCRCGWSFDSKGGSCRNKAQEARSSRNERPTFLQATLCTNLTAVAWESPQREAPATSWPERVYAPYEDKWLALAAAWTSTENARQLQPSG